MSDRNGESSNEPDSDLKDKARSEGVDTAFDRLARRPHRCLHGVSGLCCRVCNLGPCQISARSPKGICGANADTVVARNFLRQVTAGAAAHAELGRSLASLLAAVAHDRADGYTITDLQALADSARQYGLRGVGPVQAKGLARRLGGEFTTRRELAGVRLALPARRRTWRELGISPAGIDAEIVGAFHSTVMGVEHDYHSLMLRAMRVSLADGWGSSRLGMTANDILFGRPKPAESLVDLGVLGHDTVNIIVHGHNPIIAELIAKTVKDPTLLRLTHKCGAAGIRLAGMCCTGGELLARHGIPLAGHFSQQELAVVTGAVEMVVTDVQCNMPSLPDVAGGYHTMIVSTSKDACGPGVEYWPLEPNAAADGVRQLLAKAVLNFRQRDPAKVYIPPRQTRAMAGYSPSALRAIFGRYGGPSFEPLLLAMREGTIRGIVAVVGCSNPRLSTDDYARRLAEELAARDILVCTTGCAGSSLANRGLLSMEAVDRAGAGLGAFCRKYSLPPVLHLGSCLDNARLLQLLTELAAEAGARDISTLPVVAVAPEWMSEKATTIVCYMIASGVDVVLGEPLQIAGSDAVRSFLETECDTLLGAHVTVCPDPINAAKVIEERLDIRRA